MRKYVEKTDVYTNKKGEVIKEVCTPSTMVRTNLTTGRVDTFK